MKIEYTIDRQTLTLHPSDMEHLLHDMGSIKHIIKNKKIKSVYLNLKDIRNYDDYTASVISYFHDNIKTFNVSLEILSATKDFKALCDKIKSLQITLNKGRRKREHILVLIGEKTLDTACNTRKHIGYIGDLFKSLMTIIIKPKILRGNETVDLMYKVGVSAIPIVGLISFLLGLIMAFMSSIQLKQFGANIYVASLVGLAMARELGPIMTSIIVAGRSGSAFAAELGTMKISDEIDALTVMGFNINRFLVLPRVIATMIALPILTIFSNFFANVGGLLVGVFILNLTFPAYINQLYITLAIDDILHGVIKSIIFAFLIAEIGCFRGLTVQKTTDDVGKATTSAVVSGIFLIILTDSIIAVLLTYI
ncbi:MAG: ABC transporter permease [Flexistipes sinusarabici]|uniref:ABC transporter permease n=1 Tax=Flexistipes sinusarabici TaxID=2352 RepID=A0A5D0MRK4_FLESI|nr:ABC transporter permease [Flexistipes sinusarabici]TYB34188.1 MAG: ABC transporter permease [Flexistipes sinusarabici]